MRNGSSPLARGLPLKLWGGHILLRIIPARAGFTPPGGSPATSARDHPRSRGVYRPRRVSALRIRGSSPLARGLLPVHAHGYQGGGIIPARAGFTALGKTGPFDWADHPRSRGVYLQRRLTIGAFDGSSPLARGLPTPTAPALTNCRIIPARAGFTTPNAVSCGVRRDHPRSRGVYSTEIALPTEGPGSSPLARGLHLRVYDTVPEGRIIPARAGFTLR